jgi:hypothetical protein
MVLTYLAKDKERLCCCFKSMGSDSKGKPIL